MKRISLLVFVCTVLGLAAFANNIQVANVSLNGQNTAGHFSLVNFAISWDNGWRTSTNESNYDGAWVFVKYRKVNTSEWKHATINYTAPGTASASGHTEPSGATIKTGADGKGVWIYRSADGLGSVSWAGAKLRWNYGTDGVNDNDSVEIKVFAMEMVYVPTGAYYLGAGGTEESGFKNGNTTNPYLVSSASAISIANTAGNLYYALNPYSGGDLSGPVPATFPNGYNAFWLMKYEASQQQYADFLNHLDLSRATANHSGQFTGTHPNFVAAIPERAVGTISWQNLTAYADWAGVRPFTELEYEKAARGANITPVPNEYPWGNTSITGVSSFLNDGLINEGIIAYANCNYNASVPRRCGLFATSISTRDTAGAGYYGNMELGGNQWEQVVTIGTTAGRTFTNTNGDGALASTGFTDIATWLPSTSIYGLKGSSYSMGTLPQYVRTSSRVYSTYGSYFGNYGSGATSGLRLARTAE